MQATEVVMIRELLEDHRFRAHAADDRVVRVCAEVRSSTRTRTKTIMSL